MLFSNEGFYSIITNNNYDKFFNKILNLSRAGADKRKYGIPFNYEIRKNVEGEMRTLSVVHPYCQIYFIELYEKYDSLMLHLCSKSPISLRKISKVAKFYYSSELVFPEDAHKNAEVEVVPDVLDSETKYLKSYFTYEPLDLIYKFYEKSEFQRLEQRFNYLMEFDISKCFYHIYTHSITWAVKNKETAKRNSRETSFENTFDKLMQLANYNETNGIVVGPEISRIFAEIILQQVDINVLNKLDQTEFKYGVDYEIRRYVDDYFVFSNDQRALQSIKKNFQNELSFYKLYFNPTKAEIRSAPFISDVTVGKRELKLLLNNLYDSLFEVRAQLGVGENMTVSEKVISRIRRPYSISQNFIKDFQCIVKRNSLTYDILSKDIIRFFKAKITKILKDGDLEKDKDGLENLFLMIFDILFYAYSLNINSNTTFKLAQIIVLVCKYLETQNVNVKHNVYSKIFKEADFVLTNFHRKSKSAETNIETLNLLIALKKLEGGFQFSEKKILELFGINNEESYQKLNYFHLITLLYYIDSNTSYSELKRGIEKTVLNKFKEDEDPFSKSELTMLFFDFICCPFVSDQSKKHILKASKYCKSNESNIVMDATIKDISDQGKWFMDWDINIDLERVLKKKEWSGSY